MTEHEASDASNRAAKGMEAFAMGNRVAFVLVLLGGEVETGRRGSLEFAVKG